VVKAFRIAESFDPRTVYEYEGTVAGMLFDAYDQDQVGGTGKGFAWDVVREIPAFAPLIVAGGLKPVNVGSAIRHFGPYGVDVSSGVEEFPGRKDRNLMHAFIEEVLATDLQMSAGPVE